MAKATNKAKIAKTIPFFVVAAVLTIANIWFQSHDLQQLVRHATFLERLLGAGATIWFYLSKAILPANLSFVYPQWHVQAEDWRWWLPLAAAVAMTGFLYSKRETLGDRSVLFAWSFYCVALLPVMGFTDVGYMQWSLVADHYQHIALIAVTTLAAAGLTVWYDRSLPSRWIPATVAIAIVAASASLTVRQSALYGDTASLYAAAVEQNTGSTKLYNNLGNALAAKGSYLKAIESYQQALRIDAGDIEALDNLAAALANIGRTADAQTAYQNVLMTHPGDATAQNNLGRLLFDQGNLDEATAHFQKAADARPDIAEYSSNLGRCLLCGELSGAADALEPALEIDPKLPDDPKRLAVALVNSGQTEKAMKRFPELFRIKSTPPGTAGEPQSNK